MRRTDFEFGYPNSQNAISKNDFHYQFDKVFPKYQDMYKMIVMFDNRKNVIVGSGTLIIELKIGKAQVARIEDVVIEPGNF